MWGVCERVCPRLCVHEGFDQGSPSSYVVECSYRGSCDWALEFGSQPVFVMPLLLDEYRAAYWRRSKRRRRYVLVSLARLSSAERKCRGQRGWTGRSPAPPPSGRAAFRPSSALQRLSAPHSPEPRAREPAGGREGPFWSRCQRRPSFDFWWVQSAWEDCFHCITILELWLGKQVTENEWCIDFLLWKRGVLWNVM